MANWAIVIGIDQYLQQENCLRGAVRDALGVVEWLLRVDGGAVPQRNLFLLLGRAPQSPPIRPGLQTLNASKKDIVEAVNGLLQRSNGEGDSFYFYFSGHGISARKDYYEENGIVPSDFYELDTELVVSLRSIYELFKGTSFRKQFFVVDACRNLPWNSEYRIGNVGKPRPPVRPVPPQFIMYATSSGTKATEINEQGAFTEALLAALNGEGIAKEWDDNAQDYVLRWDNVFKYVKQAVEARQLPAGEGLIQAPRQDGEHSDENPELGRLTPEAVPDVALDVYLESEEAVPQAVVVVAHIGGEAQRKSAIGQLPIQFLLQPRFYSVQAIAPGYRSQKEYYTVPLYLPSQQRIKLVPGKPVTRGGGPEAYVTKGLDGSSTPGIIEVSTGDVLARLELVDSAGLVLARDEGTLLKPDLAPGFYRARLVTPEGQQVEELIELRPGATRQVYLHAAPTPDTPLFREVLATTGMRVSEDNTIEPSEAVGPVGAAHLSTVLALAGGAANEATPRGEKLRRLGVSAFRDLVGQPANNGIQLLLGIEAEDPAGAAAYLSQTQLRCWKQQDAVPAHQAQPQPLSGPTGLAEYAWAMAPGPHWLSIETPGQRPIAFAATVLPNRLSLWVFQHHVDGDVAIYQYLPALVRGPLDQPDSRRNEAHFPILQRSELIQRAYLAGRLEEPRRNATELLYAKWIEPVAGILGGYIQLRVNPRRDLMEIASRNMVLYFPELGDSHILRAEYLESQGSPDAAAQAFRAALDRGLPVMQEGLAYLLEGVARHGIEHPQVGWMQEMYARRVPGLLWTAVPVEALS